jgi:hypothetical protein
VIAVSVDERGWFQDNACVFARSVGTGSDRRAENGFASKADESQTGNGWLWTQSQRVQPEEDDSINQSGLKIALIPTQVR